MSRCILLTTVVLMLGADAPTKQALIPAPKKGDILYLGIRDAATPVPTLVVVSPSQEDWDAVSSAKAPEDFEKLSEAGTIRRIPIGCKLQVTASAPNPKLGNDGPVAVKILDGAEKGHHYWVPLRFTSLTKPSSAVTSGTADQATASPAKASTATSTERQAAAADYAAQWDKAVEDANAIYGRDPKSSVHQSIAARVLAKYPRMTEADLKVAVAAHYRAEKERQARLAADRMAAQNKAVLDQQQAALQQNEAMLQRQRMINLQRQQQLLQQQSVTEGMLQYELMRNR